MNNIRQTKEWMTTSEATNFLRVSTKTMARLIREGVVATYPHPLDRRKKDISLAKTKTNATVSLLLMSLLIKQNLFGEN